MQSTNSCDTKIPINPNWKQQTASNNVKMSSDLTSTDNNSDSCSSDEVIVDGYIEESIPTSNRCRIRTRTISNSKAEEEDVFMTETGRKVYTKGRPPWYDRAGKRLKKSYLIGICGGSASGKTTVAQKIIERLEMPWVVTVLAMDSFYNVLNEEQHHLADKQEYNFDHPSKLLIFTIDAFDFDLLYETLLRLRDGKSVEVPVYDFTTHKRSKNPKLMYGADILIFEGILSFHTPEIVDLMDMKVFVDTDSDTRLARRLQRDISERGRDVAGVLDQYIKFVKPAFDSFIAPSMKHSDIIVPRGGENLVAIDLIVRHIKNQLTERGYYGCQHTRNGSSPSLPESPSSIEPPVKLPSSLHIIRNCSGAKKFQAFLRSWKDNGKTNIMEEVMKHAELILPELIEQALSLCGSQHEIVQMQNSDNDKNINGQKYNGKVCGVTIMVTGDSLEKSLRSLTGKFGTLLIQTNEQTQDPELYYLRLPKKLNQYKIILIDTTVLTGAAAIMAIRILLDHDVREEDILFVSLLMTEASVHSLAYAFPKVKLLTTAVHHTLNKQFSARCRSNNLVEIPNFGAEAVGLVTTDDEDERAETGVNVAS
uniref:Uridine kinase n=1 Tax=Meloidogyne javanica TaxID=6303 RepID=A0A915LQV3_MELJA